MVIGPHQAGVMARSYAECGPGELFVIAGSSGYLEVSVNQGSAAKTIGCETGAPAELMIW
jgi:S-adenosylmethionine hydrolase